MNTRLLCASSKDANLEVSLSKLFYKINGVDLIVSLVEKNSFISSQFYKIEKLFKLNKKESLAVNEIMQILTEIQIDCMRVELDKKKLQEKIPQILKEYIETSFGVGEYENFINVPLIEKLYKLQDVFNESSLLDELKKQTTITY